MPRLSIAIPTRQRRALLEETLRSVVGEAEALGCEIVVSDNASEDGTRAFLEGFAALHPVVGCYFERIPRWFDPLPPLYHRPARKAWREHQRLVCRASFLVKRRMQGQIDLAFIAGATKGYALVPRLRAFAIAALPVSLARRMDEWRTSFHTRRRAVLARLRGGSS